MINILLVEDNPDHANIILNHTRRITHYQLHIHWVKSITESLEYLSCNKVDLILLDLVLPDSRIGETLNRVLKETSYAIAIVILSSLDDFDFALKEVKAGAQDFLFKSKLDTDTILKSILYALERKNIEMSLQRKNEELAQFSYRVSHDLVAPIKGTRGYIQAIQEEVQSANYEEVCGLVQRTQSQLVKLETIIHDLLSLSKTDHIEGTFEAVDLRRIIDNLIEKISSQIEENNILIQLDLQQKLQFFSHPIRVTQIMENIITNAVKYYDEKKPERFVKIKVQDKEDKQLSILVEDNGIGIAKEELDNIFKMFYRVNTNISYGSGLGLYILKKHVDVLNGDVKVNSSSEGTGFAITLPNKGYALELSA